MYVIHRSFAAPAPAIRDFWLYHTYSLLRGGFYNASSGFGPEAKTLRGQKFLCGTIALYYQSYPIARLNEKDASLTKADISDYPWP